MILDIELLREAIDRNIVGLCEVICLGVHIVRLFWDVVYWIGMFLDQCFFI